MSLPAREAGPFRALLLVAALLVPACGRTEGELPFSASGGAGDGAGGVPSPAGAGGDAVGATGADGSGAGGAPTGAVSSTTGAGGAAQGSGGEGASTTTGAGGGPPDPVACITCVVQSCPEVIDCVQDPACGQGLACVVLQCGVGGTPDLACVAECFDGDIQVALDAIGALTCVIGTCGADCLALLPTPPP